MYVEKPPDWNNARNGELTGYRGTARLLPERSSPRIKRLAYTSRQVDWGVRIAPAPVMGSPASAMTAERIVNASYGAVFTEEEGLGDAWSWIKQRFTPPAAARRFIKKGLRYTGAATAGIFMTAQARQRAFGLKGGERKFEPFAKVSRVVLATVATLGAAKYAYGLASTGKVAAGSKAFAAGTAKFTPGSIAAKSYAASQASHAAMAVKTYGAYSAQASYAATAAVNASKIATGTLEVTKGGMLYSAGKTVGKVALSGAGLMKQPAGMVMNLRDGYQDVTGSPGPTVSLKELFDTGKALAGTAATMPTPAGPDIPYDYAVPFGGGGSIPAPEFQEASFGAMPPWVMPVALGLAAYGLIFSKIKYPKKRRKK